MLHLRRNANHSKSARRSSRAWLVSAMVASLALGLVVIASASLSVESKNAGGMSSKSVGSGRQINHRISVRREGSQLSVSRELTPLPTMLLAITVDRTDDAPLAAACTAAANDCSLRGAVTLANLNPGSVITVPAGTYQLTIAGGAVEGFNGDNTIGDLDVTANNTSIIGAGAGVTTIQQTQPNDRVLELNPFLDAGFIFTISGVTISGGRETTGVGGGGIIAGSINNVTTVSNCAFSNNSATGSGTVGGGGISSLGGSLTISGSTFSGNSTTGSGGAVGYSAGDPFGRTPSVGTLNVSTSTFTNNSSTSPGVGGGALDLFNFNLGISSYVVSSSSFTGNSATNGGAVLVEGGPLVMATCSLSGNTASGAGGGVNSHGTTTIQYSRLAGNSASVATNGMQVFRSDGTLTANDNWWGRNSGPAANDFRVRVPAGTASVTPATWLQLRHSANPNTICSGGSSTLTADIKGRNSGAPLTVELATLPNFPVPPTTIFHNAVLGTISGASTQFVAGVATATFTAGSTSGTGGADASVDSETVTATIIVERNTTTDPADQAVCAGGTATFSTTTSGNGPFSYVWKKGTTVLSTGGNITIVSAGNTSTLTISNVQASDVATYTVEATGACNTDTQSAVLTVNENTSTSDPADQTVCQGATASFSTTASGTGPFHYAWTLDGTPFNGDSASINVPTGSLSVGNHTVAVTTTGACGSASQSATLTVQESTATTDPADTAVCQGATANFSTTASGTGPFSYAWTLDGSPFNGNSASINVPTGSLSVGPHTVAVTTTGACGSASQSATLTVQPTTATTDPADATVCKGATASFSTTASGTGPFHYAWTLDGSPFNGDSASINVPTGSLSVANHTVAVTTTGACGSASQSATLTVQAPTATTDPPDQTVCKGVTATFSTSASGTGPFHYAWTLDGSPFNGDSPSINVPTGSLSSGSHTVGVTTTGTCGSASQSATLTVGSPPAITISTSNINVWPPNHAYHNFNVTDFVGSVSGCDGNIVSSVVITSISSDEPENGNADGNTANDIVIAANCKSFQVRAERDGTKNGRVYRINFKVTDSGGNTATATAKVSVTNGTAIDDGPGGGYTVNSSCP